MNPPLLKLRAEFNRGNTGAIEDESKASSDNCGK